MSSSNGPAALSSSPSVSPLDVMLSPTDFVMLVNQTLEYAYSSVTIIGEVSEFKINQGKWVFFNIKDEENSVPCFMTLWSLTTPIEDGMKVVVRGTPKVTKWGKFSFTVFKIAPVGEGSLKKAYEVLKKKLSDEGLFDARRKRSLPEDLSKIGVISSVKAAGYADFIKIVNARWGGMKILTAHTTVQGLDAPEQIMRAIKYFNEKTDVSVIVIIRGGGSKDDLACFNDEALVRAVAASKIPVVCGIGHEIDESLCDLACDIRASTPSNAAELLTRDRKSEKIAEKIAMIRQKIDFEIRNLELLVQQKKRVIEILNPENILKQGYAIIGGKLDVGNVVKITAFEQVAEAEIKKVKKR
ncbi:exodeoxyribonuclease VII large subunit [Candidatus Saccharibacteria bacterium]|nr:exodeoxyribonuclease VII large subunit [Candidatus Saccharibacteria bacterium]